MRFCYSVVMFMALLMLLSGASLMAGCGKKGDLYRPVSQIPTAQDKAKAEAEAKAEAAKTKQKP